MARVSAGAEGSISMSFLVSHPGRLPYGQSLHLAPPVFRGIQPRKLPIAFPKCCLHPVQRSAGPLAGTSASQGSVDRSGPPWSHLVEHSAVRPWLCLLQACPGAGLDPPGTSTFNPGRLRGGVGLTTEAWLECWQGVCAAGRPRFALLAAICGDRFRRDRPLLVV